MQERSPLCIPTPMYGHAFFPIWSSIPRPLRSPRILTMRGHRADGKQARHLLAVAVPQGRDRQALYRSDPRGHARPVPDGGRGRRPRRDRAAAVLQKQEKPQFVEFNSQYTFDKFVVGSSNQHAFSAARAVADNPADAITPVHLRRIRLGKTHLLYAIAHLLKKRQPEARIVYIKGDDFTNELIASIREGQNREFREKYRQATLLLVDDIQFIAGKQQTQEEFFHTFNTLYESGKQIVLTSDRPPQEMMQLEDRLRTRFEWGLMVDVAPPDFETRLAIIKNKAAMLGVTLPDEVSDYIAENVTANVRQIEGTLNKILAYRDLLGDTVDEQAVGRAVKDMLKKSNEYIPSPQVIITYICKYYNLDEDVLRGQNRGRDVVNGRQIAMYLIRRMTNLSLSDIGKEFGGRDHTTVLHSLEQIEKKMKSDPVFNQTIKEITININSKR